MWSIGNEIPEQWSKEGKEIAKHLQDICHQYDPSRPVTQGMDKAEAALKSGFAQVMDVPGFNYRVHKYYKNIEQLPQGFLLGSETASTVSSRGVYKFPVQVRASNNNPYADGQCSSYDTEYCSWSNLPDDDWKMQDDYSWVIGEFVWTGYDYLGEPTPYDTYWPSRSSYFGFCDLAGLPKDRYYMYRARWNEQQHTTHLLPHWNWDGQCSSYDTEYCSWSNLPDDDWKMQDDYSWVIGEFVWTGYDYLGEPTPYDTYWPSRSSYFGFCDLAGLPKDRYYMYRARWNEQQHTTHLLPHWNWKGREGQVTPVYCYTDGVEGELFVNGKSQGRVRKDLGEPTPYDTYWPSRSSYFGICDLAGLPKDRNYMYRARRNEQQHPTHLLPHWNWKGREGQVTPVYCYTDGVEGELFVNGKSLGRVR